jgi:ornithine decarboxylase
MKQDIWRYCAQHLSRARPDHPVWYFHPAVLQATARRFQKGFPGLVTYAVKANPAPEVLDNLVAAGITTFDVASPAEMRMVRAALSDAVLHYNNPVRSVDEVAMAVRLGVASYSIDGFTELRKLAPIPDGTEVAVRVRLPVKGAAYDFGEKFGAEPDEAVHLLREVAARGYVPSMTFHPGTQCPDPAAWAHYVGACGEVARTAGITLHRLNVGGGFPARRSMDRLSLKPIHEAIRAATAQAFRPRPALVCEPGRAMVAEAYTLALRIKVVRDDGSIFLNDGIYGALSEMRDIGPVHRLRVMSPKGIRRRGKPGDRVIFGPTCDSLDRLPHPLPLPDDLAEGDYVLIEGMGAYGAAIATRFNGYGESETITVTQTTGQGPDEG